jgi:hypothetical protein
MSKTTLIIPDIHLKWKFADRIIKSVGADEVIFTGDYFDDFNDTPDMVRATAEWFVKSANTPGRIHLYGNHDVSYAFAHESWRCSGYADWKYFAINDIVTRETWDKLKWYHVLDNTFLLSHAGIHKNYVPKKVADLIHDRPTMFKELSDFLDDAIIRGTRAKNRRESTWVFAAGLSRGGFARHGGLIWCDYAREFYPFTGLNQIVGHTPSAFEKPIWCIQDSESAKPRFTLSDKYTPKTFDDPTQSINLGLDVWGTMHYAIWKDGKLSIHSYSDL